MTNKFAELGLSPLIVSAITELGFDTPTPIQEKTIPHILNSDQDLVALAQTGTGKTAAFGLPVLNRINPDNYETQAIILCPTRELCLQIHKDIANYARNMKKVNVVAVFGGASIGMQIRDLKRGAQIVVGTPGRVQDLINRKALNISKIEWLVLDEADEMLNMGFKEEIDEILITTPKSKKTLLFSATMPKGIAMITKNYMSNPYEISVGEKNSAAKKIKHIFYSVHEKDRYEALVRVIDFETNVYGIVFCRTRMETQEVASKLIQDGYPAEAIHGDISQDQRTKVMTRFRKRQIQILVATDVAARGIDVKDLTHVFNYNLPDSLETYTHRSGRTGRADSSGVSIVIINMRERRMLSIIEKKVGITFEKLLVPQAKDIVTKKLAYLFDLKTDNAILPETEKYMEEYIAANEDQNIDYKKIALGLLNMQIKEVVTKYAGARDLNVHAPETKSRFERYERSDRTFGGRPERGGRGAEGSRPERGARPERTNRFDSKPAGNADPNKNFVKVNISVGKKDGFMIKDLFNLVNSQKSLRNAKIGDIDLGDHQSMFEIEYGQTEIVKKFLTGSKFKGKVINIKVD